MSQLSARMPYVPLLLKQQWITDLLYDEDILLPLITINNMPFLFDSLALRPLWPIPLCLTFSVHVRFRVKILFFLLGVRQPCVQAFFETFDLSGIAFDRRKFADSNHNDEHVCVIENLGKFYCTEMLITLSKIGIFSYGFHRMFPVS